MIKLYLLIISLHYNLDLKSLHSIIKTESNWVSEAKGDGGRSYGLMQVKCTTAKYLDKISGKRRIYSCKDLLNPYINIDFGAHYLAHQRDKYGNLDKISAYNAGRPIKFKSGKYKNNKYVKKINLNKDLLTNFDLIF